MQPAGMSDFTGKLAGKTKCGRCRLDPATDGILRRSVVKRGIDLNSRKIPSVKCKPMRLGQVRWIKGTAPFVKIPCARTDTNFLLIDQVQRDERIVEIARREKMSPRPPQRAPVPDKCTRRVDLDLFRDGFARAD